MKTELFYLIIYYYLSKMLNTVLYILTLFNIMLEATFFLIHIYFLISLVSEYFPVDFQFPDMAELRNRLTVNRVFLFGLLSGSMDS